MTSRWDGNGREISREAVGKRSENGREAVGQQIGNKSGKSQVGRPGNRSVAFMTALCY